MSIKLRGYIALPGIVALVVSVVHFWPWDLADSQEHGGTVASMPSTSAPSADGRQRVGPAADQNQIFASAAFAAHRSKLPAPLVTQPEFQLDSQGLEELQNSLVSQSKSVSPMTSDGTTAVDGREAYLHHLSFAGCVDAPRTVADLENEVDVWLSQAAEADSPVFRQVSMGIAEQATEQYDRCAPYTRWEAMTEQFRWLEAALIAGFPLAILNYQERAEQHLLDLSVRDPGFLDAYRANAIRSLQLGVRSGHAVGFLNYAKALMDDRLLREDLEAALAYAYAAERAATTPVETETRSIVELVAVDAGDLILRAEEQLMVEQISRARKFAARLCRRYCQ